MQITKTIALAAVALSAFNLPSSSKAYADGETKADPESLTCELKTESGLGYSILTKGEGDKPEIQDAVKIAYEGRLAANGKTFDGSPDSTFAVGGVIPGFSEGLQLMETGGTYRFCIPAALGYAAQDKDNIPPNSDLVFKVTLASVIKPVPPKIEYVAEAERGCEKTSESGLGYKELVSGAGDLATDEDLALVNIVVHQPGNGQILDKSYWQQIPLPSATAGIAEGLKMMNIGSTFNFCIPGKLLNPNPDPEGKPTPQVNFRLKLVDMRKISEVR